MTKDKVSFAAACRDFFGFLPNQKPLDFGREMLLLTDKDRVEIAEGLTKNGYVVDPTTIQRNAVPPSDQRAAAA